MNRLIAIVAAGACMQTAAPVLAQTQDNPEQAAVRATLEHYLAGQATGQAQEFGQAFHEEARLHWIRDGVYGQRSDDDYIAGASGKPAADEPLRKRWIESIDVTGSAASAKIVLDYPNAVLTDYMQLLKTAEGWKIVNKIVDARPKPKP
ncbi:nuclear transport factor 2 family protein [Caulobacter henricii]|uniref:Dehydrogenase n=1 Tax=Caulobacter henricii TaxID=69395 RepID=A0A0P0NWR9_9CAUL|nr:nuclear transport factor 2 family protein [Caulobacter henricii]ALL12465.1 hypothetical protein AQ619_03345 [Caulobacter henricii]